MSTSRTNNRIRVSNNANDDDDTSKSKPDHQTNSDNSAQSSPGSASMGVSPKHIPNYLHETTASHFHQQHQHLLQQTANSASGGGRGGPNHNNNNIRRSMQQVQDDNIASFLPTSSGSPNVTPRLRSGFGNNNTNNNNLSMQRAGSSHQQQPQRNAPASPHPPPPVILGKKKVPAIASGFGSPTVRPVVRPSSDAQQQQLQKEKQAPLAKKAPNRALLLPNNHGNGASSPTKSVSPSTSQQLPAPASSPLFQRLNNNNKTNSIASNNKSPGALMKLMTGNNNGKNNSNSKLGQKQQPQQQKITINSSKSNEDDVFANRNEISTQDRMMLLFGTKPGNKNSNNDAHNAAEQKRLGDDDDDEDVDQFGRFFLQSNLNFRNEPEQQPVHEEERRREENEDEEEVDEEEEEEEEESVETHKGNDDEDEEEDGEEMKHDDKDVDVEDEDEDENVNPVQDHSSARSSVFVLPKIQIEADPDEITPNSKNNINNNNNNEERTSTLPTTDSLQEDNSMASSPENMTNDNNNSPLFPQQEPQILRQEEARVNESESASASASAPASGANSVSKLGNQQQQMPESPFEKVDELSSAEAIVATPRDQTQGNAFNDNNNHNSNNSLGVVSQQSLNNKSQDHDDQIEKSRHDFDDDDDGEEDNKRNIDNQSNEASRSEVSSNARSGSGDLASKNNVETMNSGNNVRDAAASDDNNDHDEFKPKLLRPASSPATKNNINENTDDHNDHLIDSASSSQQKSALGESTESAQNQQQHQEQESGSGTISARARKIAHLTRKRKLKFQQDGEEQDQIFTSNNANSMKNKIMESDENNNPDRGDNSNRQNLPWAAPRRNTMPPNEAPEYLKDLAESHHQQQQQQSVETTLTTPSQDNVSNNINNNIKNNNFLQIPPTSALRGVGNDDNSSNLIDGTSTVSIGGRTASPLLLLASEPDVRSREAQSPTQNEDGTRFDDADVQEKNKNSCDLGAEIQNNNGYNGGIHLRSSSQNKIVVNSDHNNNNNSHVDMKKFAASNQRMESLEENPFSYASDERSSAQRRNSNSRRSALIQWENNGGNTTNLNSFVLNNNNLMLLSRPSSAHQQQNMTMLKMQQQQQLTKTPPGNVESNNDNELLFTNKKFPIHRNLTASSGNINHQPNSVFKAFSFNNMNNQSSNNNNNNNSTMQHQKHQTTGATAATAHSPAIFLNTSAALPFGNKSNNHNNFLNVSHHTNNPTAGSPSTSANTMVAGENHWVSVLSPQLPTTAVDRISCACRGPENSSIVIIGGDTDGAVHALLAGTPDIILSLEGHATAVVSLCYENKSDTLFSCSVDATIRMWDCRTKLSTLRHENDLNSWPCVMSFSKSHFGLIVGLSCFYESPGCGPVDLWQQQQNNAHIITSSATSKYAKKSTHQQEKNSPTTPAPTSISSASSAPSYYVTGKTGKLHLFTGGDDRVIKMWNTETGSCRASMRGHRGPVNILCLDPLLPCVLYSGATDGYLKLWCVPTVETVFSSKDASSSEARRKKTRNQMNNDGEAANSRNDSVMTLEEILSAVRAQNNNHSNAAGGNANNNNQQRMSSLHGGGVDFGSSSCLHTVEAHAEGVWSILPVFTSTSQSTHYSPSNNRKNNNNNNNSAFPSSPVITKITQKIVTGGSDGIVKVWNVVHEKTNQKTHKIVLGDENDEDENDRNNDNNHTHVDLPFTSTTVFLMEFVLAHGRVRPIVPLESHQRIACGTSDGTICFINLTRSVQDGQLNYHKPNVITGIVVLPPQKGSKSNAKSDGDEYSGKKRKRPGRRKNKNGDNCDDDDDDDGNNNNSNNQNASSPLISQFRASTLILSTDSKRKTALWVEPKSLMIAITQEQREYFLKEQERIQKKQLKMYHQRQQKMLEAKIKLPQQQQQQQQQQQHHHHQLLQGVETAVSTSNDYQRNNKNQNQQQKQQQQDNDNNNYNDENDVSHPHSHESLQQSTSNSNTATTQQITNENNKGATLQFMKRTESSAGSMAAASDQGTDQQHQQQDDYSQESSAANNFENNTNNNHNNNNNVYLKDANEEYYYDFVNNNNDNIHDEGAFGQDVEDEDNNNYEEDEDQSYYYFDHFDEEDEACLSNRELVVQELKKRDEEIFQEAKRQNVGFFLPSPNSGTTKAARNKNSNNNNNNNGMLPGLGGGGVGAVFSSEQTQQQIDDFVLNEHKNGIPKNVILEELNLMIRTNYMWFDLVFYLPLLTIIIVVTVLDIGQRDNFNFDSQATSEIAWNDAIIFQISSLAKSLQAEFLHTPFSLKKISGEATTTKQQQRQITFARISNEIELDFWFEQVFTSQLKRLISGAPLLSRGQDFILSAFNNINNNNCSASSSSSDGNEKNILVGPIEINRGEEFVSPPSNSMIFGTNCSSSKNSSASLRQFIFFPLSSSNNNNNINSTLSFSHQGITSISFNIYNPGIDAMALIELGFTFLKMSTNGKNASDVVPVFMKTSCAVKAYKLYGINLFNVLPSSSSIISPANKNSTSSTIIQDSSSVSTTILAVDIFVFIWSLLSISSTMFYVISETKFKYQYTLYLSSSSNAETNSRSSLHKPLTAKNVVSFFVTSYSALFDFFIVLSIIIMFGFRWSWGYASQQAISELANFVSSSNTSSSQQTATFQSFASVYRTGKVELSIMTAIVTTLLTLKIIKFLPLVPTLRSLASAIRRAQLFAPFFMMFVSVMAFATAGLFWFGPVCRGEIDSGYYDSATTNGNRRGFSTFSSSIITVLRLLLSDTNGVTLSCPPLFSSNGSNHSSSSSSSFAVYFWLLWIVCRFILLNVITSVLIESFDSWSSSRGNVPWDFAFLLSAATCGDGSGFSASSFFISSKSSMKIAELTSPSFFTSILTSILVRKNKPGDDGGGKSKAIKSKNKNKQSQNNDNENKSKVFDGSNAEFSHEKDEEEMKNRNVVHRHQNYDGTDNDSSDANNNDKVLFDSGLLRDGNIHHDGKKDLHSTSVLKNLHDRFANRENKSRDAILSELLFIMFSSGIEFSLSMSSSANSFSKHFRTSGHDEDDDDGNFFNNLMNKSADDAGIDHQGIGFLGFFARLWKGVKFSFLYVWKTGWPRLWLLLGLRRELMKNQNLFSVNRYDFIEIMMTLAEKSVKVEAVEKMETEEEAGRENLKKKLAEEDSDSSSSDSSSSSKSSENTNNENAEKQHDANPTSSKREKKSKENNHNNSLRVENVGQQDEKNQHKKQESQRMNEKRKEIVTESSVKFLELAIIFSAVGVDLWRYFVTNFHFAHRKSRKSVQDGSRIRAVASAVDESLQ